MNKKEMLELEGFELNKRKSDSRVLTHLTLLGIVFTLFGLIVTINPELLKNSFLSYQLVLAIPLFLSSIFTHSKMAYVKDATKWQRFGFITFIFAYGFLINSVGLLLVNFISYKIAIAFFIVNILSAISYSSISVAYDKRTLKKRIYRDLTFALIIIILGILPVLGIF